MSRRLTLCRRADILSRIIIQKMLTYEIIVIRTTALMLNCTLYQINHLACMVSRLGQLGNCCRNMFPINVSLFAHLKPEVTGRDHAVSCTKLRCTLRCSTVY